MRTQAEAAIIATEAYPEAPLAPLPKVWTKTKTDEPAVDVWAALYGAAFL